jgi:outer membrane protein insertion porin family
MKFFPLLLALWLQAPAQAPAPPQVVDIVLVQGNKRITTQTVKTQIQTKAGDELNPALIARDIRAVYATWEAFEDVVVTTEPGENGRVIVIFTVKEKPLIRNVAYDGLSSIQVSDVMKALSDRKATLSQGQVYDETKIQKARVIIQGLLAEKGRQKAQVEVSREIVPPNSALVTFTINEGPQVKIEEIDFKGNQVFTDRALKKAMKLVKEAGALTGFTGKDAYHEGKFAYDLSEVRKLYLEKGYIRVNISDPEVEERQKKIYRTLPFIKPTFPWGVPLPFWTKTVDRVYVGVKVEENDQYHLSDLKITGTVVGDPEKLKDAIGLKTGDVYNENLLRQSFDNLKKLYGQIGFVDFVATPQQEFDDEKKLVSMTIDISEGKPYIVRRLFFSGNTTTRDKVVRREVPLLEGGLFNSNGVDFGRAKLNQLGYFEEIKEEDAKVDPNQTDSTVDVTMKVQEKGRNTIGFNGGVSGIGGSFIGGNYETNNFLGFGETLTLNVMGGTRQSNVMVSFQEPYLLDRPLSVGFSVFHSNFKYDQARELFGLDPRDLPEGLGFENRLNFQQKRDGFSVYGGYPVRFWKLSNWARFGLTYQFDNSETDAVNPATQDYFQNVRTSEQQSFSAGQGSFGRYRTRKLIPSFVYNTVDHPYYPSRGKSVSLTFEYNGGPLGGNTNYYRPTMEFRYFKPHTRRGNVIAMRFSASHVRGFGGTSVPFYERFFPGGDYDIRGFEFRSIGPISFLTRNVDKLDPETGGVITAPFDDIVYIGGDTQSVFNLEYRIPIVGKTVTLAPFVDIGNAWVINKKDLTREVVNFSGQVVRETATFLPGSNSGVRMSTGVEVGVTLPVLNAPFRVIMAWNPQRLDRVYNGPTTGLPFALREEKKGFKFTVGKTF